MRTSLLALACLLLASPAVRGEGQAEMPWPTREAPLAREDGRRTRALLVAVSWP